MKSVKRVLVALTLALVMAAVPVVPFMQPVIAQADEAASMQEIREYVSVTELIEGYGGTITLDNEARSIHIALQGGSIVLFIGSNTALVNGVDVELEASVFALNGVAYMYVGDVDLVFEVFDSTLWYYMGLTRLYLTEEARDLVLYDFDFVINAIIENTPWESVINRRFDTDFLLYAEAIRHQIYTMTPFVIPVNLAFYEETRGAPIYEILFPIREGDDPRDMAATYLSYLLFYWMVNSFEGIGHMWPMTLSSYTTMYTMVRRMYYNGTLIRENSPVDGLLFDLYTHPDAARFYGEVEVDLYAHHLSVREEVEGNITTEIIVPGEIAYLAIGTFHACAFFDDLVTIPFFEEIQNYDHLIIDLRGNGGGWGTYFPDHIFSRLISEPTVVVSHEFFAGGDAAMAYMNALAETYDIWLAANARWAHTFSYEIMPARDFINQQVMTAFNRSDYQRLDYVFVTSTTYYPTLDGITFDGNVWLLVDGRSSSASNAAAQMVMSSGRATVVGANTSGIMGPSTTFVVLPNTGMLFRIDIGYMTDIFGNSLEAYGIAPHVHNFEGMDALETVLALIEQGDF